MILRFGPGIPHTYYQVQAYCQWDLQVSVDKRWTHDLLSPGFILCQPIIVGLYQELWALEWFLHDGVRLMNYFGINENWAVFTGGWVCCQISVLEFLCSLLCVFFEAVELRNGTDNASLEQRKTRKKVVSHFLPRNAMLARYLLSSSVSLSSPLTSLLGFVVDLSFLQLTRFWLTQHVTQFVCSSRVSCFCLWQLSCFSVTVG